MYTKIPYKILINTEGIIFINSYLNKKISYIDKSKICNKLCR